MLLQKHFVILHLLVEFANPLLKPLLIKMCKVGLNIIRKKITGNGFQRLSEENRQKGMDTIYAFLKDINQEQLLFV